MKSLINIIKKKSLYVGVFALAMGFNSCSDDDDGDVIIPEQDSEATASFTANDQTLMGNTLLLEDVSVGQDSWVVVRNAGGTAVVSDTVMVDEGDQEVRIPLQSTANLSGNAEGDDFEVSFYADNPDEGVQGEFDSVFDDPITDDSGTNVTQTVNVTAPSLSAEDGQTITENNEVTFTSVNIAGPGWIGLYAEDVDGNIDYTRQIGRAQVSAGMNENVTVQFNEDYVYEDGTTIYPRLYMDDDPVGTWDYAPGGTLDQPEFYGWNTTTGEVNWIGNNGLPNGGFTAVN